MQDQMSGPGEMLGQCPGLPEMVMRSVGHPWTQHLINEPLLCARHWPRLEVTKRYLGQTVLRESAFFSGVRAPGMGSGRMVFEQAHESAEAFQAEEMAGAEVQSWDLHGAPSLSFSWVGSTSAPPQGGGGGGARAGT